MSKERVYMAYGGKQERVTMITPGMPRHPQATTTTQTDETATTYIFSDGLQHTCYCDDCVWVNKRATVMVTRD